MKSALALVILAASTSIADARIKPYVQQEPARERASGERYELRVSQFPDQRFGDQVYDLWCPHTSEANPLIVIAPELRQSLEYSEGMAYALARVGFVVVVVAPPNDPTLYPAALAAMLEEVAREPTADREPGCKLAGPIGAWGYRFGGVAVLELARQREAAGQPLAGVATAFVVETAVPVPTLTTPTLVIEGAPAPALGGRALVIDGATACLLRGHTDPCKAPSNPRASYKVRQRDEDLESQRSNLLYERTKQFMLARVGGSEHAGALVAAWGHEVKVQPSAAFVESHERGTYKMFSLPVVLGGTNQGDHGVVAGLRPELVIGRLNAERAIMAGSGYGIGIYGELSRENGLGLVGAGATLVSYSGGLGVAPSIGVFSRMTETGWNSGYSLGLFLGARHRAADFEVLDLPFGVRVDYRKTSTEDSVNVALQIDLALPALAAIGLASAFSVHD